MNNERNRKSESGFTLVEALVAVAVFILIGVLSAYLMTSNVRSVENNATAEAVTNTAEEALSQLIGSALTMQEGGSFELRGEEIQVGACTPQTCDIILDPAPGATMLTSPAKGIPFVEDYVPPQGYSVRFYRLWRVDEIDAEYKLRQITVAIVPKLKTSEALLIQKTKVGVTN
jgi:type II secretory pathway pseudopilin PulG